MCGSLELAALLDFLVHSEVVAQAFILCLWHDDVSSDALMETQLTWCRRNPLRKKKVSYGSTLLPFLSSLWGR